MQNSFWFTFRFYALPLIALRSALCLPVVVIPLLCSAQVNEPNPKILRDCVECPEMVALKAGSFRMGSPEQEANRNGDESLRHGVRIAPFALGKYEVTVAQYLACVQANACTVPAWQTDRPYFSALGASVERGQNPVVGVSWHQAQSYVQWLGRITTKTYYLPSETQWEYAARAGSASRWSFGDSAAPAVQYAWFEDNSNGALQPIGSLRPNAWGLHDMHGSVWEWVQDCYERWDNYDHFDPRYGKAPQTENAWQSEVCNLRVARGGSWKDAVARLRSASRYYNYATNATTVVGFRVARTL